MPYLVDVWLLDYGRVAGETDVVETTVSNFAYLFDIAAERLIAAWGISQGRFGGKRDKSRMAGHPLSAGPRYHRGHAIPHTLGGPTDINLVPQRGSVNVGQFRVLEKRAVADAGVAVFHLLEVQPADGSDADGCRARATGARTEARDSVAWELTGRGRGESLDGWRTCRPTAEPRDGMPPRRAGSVWLTYSRT